MNWSAKCPVCDEKVADRLRDASSLETGSPIIELDGGYLFFCQDQQRVYQVDVNAAEIWLALANSRPPDDLIARPAAKEGHSSEGATEYLPACLDLWRRFGSTTERPAACKKPPSMAGLRSPGKLRPHDVFSLMGIPFGVACPDRDIANAVRSVFGHLQPTAGEPPCCVFDIRAEPHGYRILAPGRTDRPLKDDPAAVAVSLKSDILDALLLRLPDAIAIHAAALAAPTGGVLLVGPSGVGKTTLAAMLNARGWPSIADDVVILRSGRTRAWGLPLAYAAKPGSWPILSGEFPELEAEPIYRRPDGKMVKYIRPSSFVNASEGTTVRALVFPRRTEREPFQLRAFSKIEALVRILTEARNASQTLTTVAFLSLVEILRGASVLELIYRQADCAVDMLMQMAGCSDDISAASGKLELAAPAQMSTDAGANPIG
jgi:hypothetical protein